MTGSVRGMTDGNDAEARRQRNAAREAEARGLLEAMIAEGTLTGGDVVPLATLPPDAVVGPEPVVRCVGCGATALLPAHLAGTKERTGLCPACVQRAREARGQG